MSIHFAFSIRNVGFGLTFYAIKKEFRVLHTTARIDETQRCYFATIKDWLL